MEDLIRQQIRDSKNLKPNTIINENRRRIKNIKQQFEQINNDIKKFPEYTTSECKTSNYVRVVEEIFNKYAAKNWTISNRTQSKNTVATRAKRAPNTASSPTRATNFNRTKWTIVNHGSTNHNDGIWKPRKKKKKKKNEQWKYSNSTTSSTNWKCL